MAAVSSGVFNQSLFDALTEMHDLDQAIRGAIFKPGTEELIDNWENHFEVIQKVDEQHYPLLEEIVNQYGWPGHQLVGEQGSKKMWNLVQHCDLHIDFQEKCLKLLKQAVDQQDAEKAHLAYLTDRVRLNQGLPQIYGTQWQIQGTERVLRPTEDLEHLNERRAEMGLEPIKSW